MMKSNNVYNSAIQQIFTIWAWQSSSQEEMLVSITQNFLHDKLSSQIFNLKEFLIPVNDHLSNFF